MDINYRRIVTTENVLGFPKKLNEFNRGEFYNTDGILVYSITLPNAHFNGRGTKFLQVCAEF